MTPRAATLAALLLALAGCGPTLATRYERGNAALSTPEGAMYFVAMSPVLQRALNACIAPGAHAATPTTVLVADIDAAGVPSAVRVEPGSPQTDCIERELKSSTFPRPPLRDGAASFPVGLRIDDR